MKSSLTLMGAPFLLFMLCGASAVSQKEMTAELYWRTILPQTPIPATIHELISSELKSESLESEKSPNIFIKYKPSEKKSDSLESEKSPTSFVKYKSSEKKSDSLDSEKGPTSFIKYKSSEKNVDSLESEKRPTNFVNYKSSDSLESNGPFINYKSSGPFINYKSSASAMHSHDKENGNPYFAMDKSIGSKNLLKIRAEHLESEKSPNVFIKYKPSEKKSDSLESEKRSTSFIKYKSSEKNVDSLESEKRPTNFVNYKSSEKNVDSLESEKRPTNFVNYKSSEKKSASLESEKGPTSFIKYKSSEKNVDSLESEKRPTNFVNYKSSEKKSDSLESENGPTSFVKYKSSDSLESNGPFINYKSSASAMHSHGKENGNSYFAMDKSIGSKNLLSNDPASKEPNAALLFLEESLKPGTMMTGDLTKMRTIRPFLPAGTARKTPFCLTKLPEILTLFSIDSSSPEAAVVHRTLSECEELQLLDDERRRCATSLESMVDFVESELGDRDVRVLETALRGDGEVPPKQEYKVGPAGARLVRAEALVSCHPEPYPRAVYYCHRTTSTEAYMVQLMGADGAEVSAVATCHTDTSTWSPDYIGFKLFNVKPGTHICHFMPQGHIIFARLAKNKANAAY